MGHHAASLIVRSEEEILAGVLWLNLGGEEFPVRELRIAGVREWKRQLTAVLGEFGNMEYSNSSELPKLILGFLDASTDHQVDLILAYDREGKITGGREWIEENASTTEVYHAFRKMVESAFPFVQDVEGMVKQVQALMKAAQSQQESSTSTPLPIGGSTRKRSKVA